MLETRDVSYSDMVTVLTVGIEEWEIEGPGEALSS